jgi:hypothetical protein
MFRATGERTSTANWAASFKNLSCGAKPCEHLDTILLAPPLRHTRGTLHVFDFSTGVSNNRAARLRR